MCKTTLFHLACEHTRNHYTKFCLCESNFDGGEVEGYCRICMMEWDGIIPAVAADIKAEMQKQIRVRVANGIRSSPGGAVGGLDPRFLELMGVLNRMQGVVVQQPGRVGLAAPTFTGITQPGLILGESFTMQSDAPSQEQPTRLLLEQAIEQSVRLLGKGLGVQDDDVPMAVTQPRLSNGDRPQAENYEPRIQDGASGSAQHAMPLSPALTRPVLNPGKPQAGAVQGKKLRRKSTAGTEANTPKPGKKVQEAESKAFKREPAGRDEASTGGEAAVRAETPTIGPSSSRVKGPERAGNTQGGSEGNEAGVPKSVTKTPRAAATPRACSSSTRGEASGRGIKAQQGKKVDNSKAASVKGTTEPVETRKRGEDRARGRGAAASKGQGSRAAASKSGSRPDSKASEVAKIKEEEQTEGEAVNEPPEKRGRRSTVQNGTN